jgi:uncharacterized repeat protein (TIGR03803 family)
MLRQSLAAAFIGALAIFLAIAQTPRAQAQDTFQDTFKVLHPFTWLSFPSGSLAVDAAGNLYGTTSQGGDGNCNGMSCGVVYELKRNQDGSFTIELLHVFGGAEKGDGGDPVAGVIFDSAGNLYGMTQLGGSSKALCHPVGCGTVFKLSPDGNGAWTESVLYSFLDGADGRFPAGGLVFDSDGNLYGTTQYGGSTGCSSTGCGTVFKLSASSGESWTESTLYTFTGGPDGGTPASTLIFDKDGNLYGTTTTGGSTGCSSNGCGVVFKLSLGTGGHWTESVLHTFIGGAYGAIPNNGLVFDKAGRLYGMTEAGGISAKVCGVVHSLLGCGVVFKLTPGTGEAWSESVIHSFNGWDGAHPTEALVFDSNGNLYGTTPNGGQIQETECGGFGGCGLIFRLSSSGSAWSETVLHVFVGYGVFPFAPLSLDAAGNLYGTTLEGENYDHGIVFELTP